MEFRVLKSKKLWGVLKDLVIVEVGAYLIFMGLALTADWGKIFEDFALARYVRFEIVEFSFLGLSQLLLILFVFSRAAAKENEIEEMLRSGEHERLEFKTSFRWDEKRRQVNKELEKAIMKTVAAFLNSDGGHLLIGVGDKGQPTGLEKDFASLPKPDSDGFENHFNNLFNQMIGPKFRRLVKLTFDKIEEKTVCLANVGPSQQPVYLKNGENEDFYIRTGNVTTPLKMSEVSAYLSSWKKF
ncbi:MAG: hypothetical protein A3I92_00555 [Candidatus Yanofskybacteria bacterium RIFCSPLOWO2_02_FULL_43_10b]|uniref:Schlafen AlbA-2 domain-containing protein n=1 Tax=Candidatus Yanofskybacteria bacterium RIFCSPLOWO2_02_FULL_43_10b TaxID=1802704 RepID=A0A1F8H2K4_9BACT|nr:MAG: hypothetical protein A3I92_00555 [Candidatus Yanofskybacteria bacterium RIFCSPLOWO2_02_FULL_43_10b]